MSPLSVKDCGFLNNKVVTVYLLLGLPANDFEQPINIVERQFSLLITPIHDFISGVLKKAATAWRR
jgi:hypothetical protein